MGLSILFRLKTNANDTVALVGPQGHLRSILGGTERKTRDEPHPPRDEDHSDRQMATSVGRSTLRRTVDPVTIASAVPGSVGAIHGRVFVPPSLLKNTARVSNASGAILPNPPGYESPCWRPRASDIDHYALRAPDMPCHDASWLRTSERCSGYLADSHSSASPFEAAAWYPLDFPLDSP